MDATTILFLIFIGIIAGGYGTIVGAGGGFIFVPALLLILTMDPVVAAGSGLVIVLINSLSGTLGYARQKKIDYRTGGIISIGALPGSLLGIWFFTSVYFKLFLYCFCNNINFVRNIFIYKKYTR